MGKKKDISNNLLVRTVVLVNLTLGALLVLSKYI